MNYLGDWIPVFQIHIRDDGRVFLQLEGIWVDQEDVRGLTPKEIGA